MQKMQKTKSSPYKLNGKLFRYDFKRSMVEYICKADAEIIADEAEWKQKYGKPLYGIDADGYIVISRVGLHKENWVDKEARNEYLSGWCSDIDEESEALVDNFVKYELPYLGGAVG